MSRKRLSKKQRKRQHAWVDELQDLYLRDEDDAFLAAVHGDGQPAGPRDLTPVADAYREVVDRVLGRALAAGDLDRLEELAGRLHKTARSQPLAVVAEAVADLGRGRCAAARSRLAALQPAPGLAPLVRGLLALCETDPALPGAAAEVELDLLPEALRREISDLTRLARTPAPAAKPAGAPRTAAVADLLAVLDGLRRQARPGPKVLARLSRAAKALETAGLVGLPQGDAAARLTRTLEEHVELLAELADVERALRQRARRGTDLHRLLLDRLAARRLPVGWLHEPAPALLAPLWHALRVRWRGLLELVAEHDGDGALAALYAARPRLFAADLEIPATAGPRALSQRTTVEELLQAGKLDRLAKFLAACSAEEKDPARRAELWSFELRTRHEDFEARWEEFEGLEDEPEDGPEGRPDPHPTLARVGWMSAAIGDAFPADQHRDVARALRRELLDLVYEMAICSCFNAPTAHLRRFLPDDPGLLIVAVAGAVAASDRKARRRLEAEIAGRRKLRGGDDLLPLLSEVAAEDPARVVAVLGSIRPLFAEDFWQEILRVAADRVDSLVGTALREALQLARFDREGAAWILTHVERDLETYRPVLSGQAELEAMFLLLECCNLGPRAPSADGTAKRCAAFLRRFPDLEGALTLFRKLVFADPDLLPGCGPAREAAIAAVIQRLDHRWSLWRPAIAILSLCAGKRQRTALKKKIRQLLKDPSLAGEDRLEMEDALDEVDRAAKLQRLGLGDLDAHRPEPRKPKSGGEPRRRRAKQNPGQLELPGLA